MPILRPYLEPTVAKPDDVALIPRKRQPRRMDSENFYETLGSDGATQERENAIPQFNSPEVQVQVNAPSQENQNSQQFINPPTSGAYVNEFLTKMENRAAPPELNPGARVKSPSAELVQPSNFQSFYESLGTIGGIGQQALGAEQARAAHRQQQALMKIFAQQPPGFGGVTLKPGNHSTQGIRGLGPVQPYVANIAGLISNRYGINHIGGHATSGHIRNSDHYTGRALDVMLGNRSGNSIVRDALHNAGPWRVKYVIYNRTYYEPGERPVAYTGSNPHTGHVHISFY